ncbi:beta-ketoacyl-ACP synthase [Minwuia sp.]|uniref:beta-ketoacyl-ACP synthase n=1 Tax=Minwuia sp. TaxID=2493630 RepID=UPI003A927445
MTKRVAVTGMAGISALGNDWPAIRDRMLAGETATRSMPQWDHLQDLDTRLAAPADHFAHEKAYPRKKMRSMGRVATLAVSAAEKALQDADLIDDPVLTSGRTGVSCGSSYGSTEPARDFVKFLESGKAGSLNATSYVRMMNHTSPVNIGVFFQLRGRVITTSSACTSGSQGIGYAFEAIRHGYADVMIAGGAEELCPSMAAVFDTLYATSTRNDDPGIASRPFDADRDGLVIGEGSAILILEEYEHARERGAEIIVELVGFATNSDGAHITQPMQATQALAMREALTMAGITPDAVGFISGHGTATELGDIAESRATSEVYGDKVPFHSLKGHFGHTLGACGALEAWLALEMRREGWFAGTANLQRVDERCGALDYVQGAGGRKIDCEYVVSNNFAFGGINTSLVFRAT